MKKLIIATLMTAALAGNVLAQGTVSLYANGTGHGVIAYSTDGNAKTSFPVGATSTAGTYGQLNVAVYSATVGTPTPFTATAGSLLPSTWAISGNILHGITPAPGWTATTTFTLPAPVAGGSPAQVMVLGWTGAFTDWNSAFTAGTGLLGWAGSTLSTGALSWSNGTATISPPGTPTPLTYGANGFNGLVLTAVPEPTSFALAGLGLASLLIFRRRK